MFKQSGPQGDAEVSYTNSSSASWEGLVNKQSAAAKSKREDYLGRANDFETSEHWCFHGTELLAPHSEKEQNVSL